MSYDRIRHESTPARWRVTRRSLYLATLCSSAWLLVCGYVQAFTLGDHAVKAFIRPAPLLVAHEAEACVDGATPVPDDRAANGAALLLKADGPALTFSQELQRGTYSLWCIARSTGKPTGYREPVYLEMRVAGTGETPPQQWRMRVNYEHGRYQDVSHMYVDIHEPGSYTFSLSLGGGSHFDLLVDRLELRDELANTWRRGFKTRPTLYLEPAPWQEPEDALSDEALRKLAVRLAASLPPRNVLLTSGGMPKEGYYQEFGLADARTAEPTADRWRWRITTPLDQPWVFTGPLWPVRDEMDELLAETEALKDPLGGGMTVEPSAKLAGFGVAPPRQPDINWGTSPLGKSGRYTIEDFRQFKPLPGRWPDDGNGYFIPAGTIGIADNRYFNNVAGEFKSRYTSYRSTIVSLADDFYTTGDTNAGIRGALMLIFYADAFPSLDNTVQGTANVTWGITPFNDFSGNRAGVYGKLDYSGWAANANLPVALAYDKLFPMIDGNQALADAVHEVIPWVKTPEDVIELVDVKLVQHMFDVADRGLIRFAPGLRCDPRLAVVQGDNEAGRAMLKTILLEGNPQHPSLLDGIVVRHSRDTTSYIGSMFYAKGPSFNVGLSMASLPDFGVAANPETFDMPMHLYRQSARWLYEAYVAGVHIPGVGDVSGPRGYPRMIVGDPSGARSLLLAAWRQFGDPEFAWMLQHVYGLPHGLGDEAQAIATSAATCPGDPRKTRRSRVLGGFGVAILEANPEEADFRRRVGLVLRAGYGSGHSHADQLNIELFAFGIPMMPEFGGRGGYGTPETTAAKSHCLVTVDGRVASSGQVRWLADLPGVQAVDAVGGQIRRTVALVTVSDQASYLVDFSRATGGTARTYWFHGQQTEMLDQRAAASAATGIEAMTEPDGLDELGADILEEAKPKTKWTWNKQVFSDNAEGTTLTARPYQAVWPLGRPMEDSVYRLVGHGHRFAPGQKPDPLVPDGAPRKFTRLILMPSAGRTVERFTAVSEQVNYRIPCVGITEKRKATDDSRFTAVVETFAGQAAIQEVRSLPVTPNDGRAVALAIDLPDGRTDLFFQSDAPDQRYSVGGAHPFTVRGEFAHLRYDGATLVACGLAGGQELSAGGATLTLPAATMTATITSVDFHEQRVLLDRTLPVRTDDLLGSTWQIGRDTETFTVDRVEQTDAGTVLYCRKSAEVYRSPLLLTADGDPTGIMEMEARIRHGWLTDESRTRGWPVNGVAIGKYRWMGTSFRGGARMGGPLDWDRIPDADGDGKRTLTIGAHDMWTESMTAEVLRVDEDLRAFYFRPLNKPAGYAGTRSYADAPITNEAGEFISTTMMPGKPTTFQLAETVTDADFSDADGDGVTRIHVYMYGPGDPVVLPMAVGLEKRDGRWQGRGTADWTFTPPTQ